MFKNIADGLEVYKKECYEYFKKLKEYKKIYGADSHPMLTWDDVHYNWISENSAKLQGMERVLGLSEEEVKQIEEEIKSSL